MLKSAVLASSFGLAAEHPASSSPDRTVLVPDPGELPPEETGYVDVSVGDFAVIGATMLYRLGRLAAAQYLQILGGFVRPAVH